MDIFEKTLSDFCDLYFTPAKFAELCQIVDSQKPYTPDGYLAIVLGLFRRNGKSFIFPEVSATQTRWLDRKSTPTYFGNKSSRAILDLIDFANCPADKELFVIVAPFEFQAEGHNIIVDSWAVSNPLTLIQNAKVEALTY